MNRLRMIIHEHRWFVAIVALAVMAHLAGFVTLKSASSSSPDILHATYPVGGGGFDSWQYAVLADNLIEYGVFALDPGPSGIPETFRTPAYPAFVAVVKAATGTFDAVPVAQILLLVATAFLLYRMVLENFPEYRTAGLAAIAVFLFDPATFYASLMITTEVMYGFAIVLAAYLLFHRWHHPMLGPLLSGLALGISTLVRPSGIYMAIPIVLWLVWFVWKDLGARKMIVTVIIFIAALAVVLLPWYARNSIRTGVFGLSSLESYNPLNFNVPLYLSYASGYKLSVEDVRDDLHKKIGDISDEEQMDLRNSPRMKEVVLSVLKPNLPGYAVFHLVKTANFFFSPGLKLELQFLEGFRRPQPIESWHQETSIMNSLIDGRWSGVAAWLSSNVFYLPESIVLVAIFIFGAYWTVRSKNKAAVLLFVVFLFMGILTSPISNPRYRMPVSGMMYLCGIAGMVLYVRNKRNARSQQ